MKQLWTRLALPLAFSSGLLLTACNKEPEQKNTAPAQQTDTISEVIKQVERQPIKNFAATADDAHDIAQLEQFDQRFTEMSDEMENELIKMQQEGTLTAAFDRDRKRDNVQSALNMLKELELKTEQGRYIQGLLYQYWENQAQLAARQAQTQSDDARQSQQQISGLADYLHAQKQLQHWKAQQPASS